MAETAVYKLRMIAEHLWKALKAIETSSSLEPANLEEAKRKLGLINLAASVTLEEHPFAELYSVEASAA
jgi:hypothetical protein